MKPLFLVLAGLFAGYPMISQTLSEGNKFLYYERYQSAGNVLHEVIKKDPENAEAWYLLTRAYIKQDKIKQAADSLQLAPQNIKGEPYYEVAAGSILLQQKDASKAAEHFNDALEKTKRKNADILLAVANAHIDAEAGNINEAIDLLNAALKREKHSAAILTALGNAYRKTLKSSEAYQTYQQAINEDVKFAEASYRLGMIFTTQKNPEMYLKFFNQAIAADPQYAPALYQLYFHYYFRDVNTAMDYLKRYIAVTDHKLQNDYDYTDLLYLTGKYDEAILRSKNLIQSEKEKAPPRLYKLIAYSYKETGDSVTALDYMKQYFAIAPDSMYVVKDFTTMADLLLTASQEDSAMSYYRRAVQIETDSTGLLTAYKKLADLSKKQKNYTEQAAWLGKYYSQNSRASNVDLFNWGIAHFMAGEYVLSDTVFARYAEKYPDQDFGYYWRARSNAAIDTAMDKGLAVPHYLDVIELAEKDTAKELNRKRLIEAYKYLAAFETNHEKDYEEAIDYFEKLLVLDPANADAIKYIDILKKNLEKKQQTATDVESPRDSK